MRPSLTATTPYWKGWTRQTGTESGTCFERGEKGHLDPPQAREWDLETISSPSRFPSPKSRPSQRDPEKLPHATDHVYALSYSLVALAALFRIVDLSDGKSQIARTAADIRSSASREYVCSLNL